MGRANGWILAVGACALVGASGASARAEGAPPAPAAPVATPSAAGDEPELTGEAKEKHAKEVKAHLAALRGEKNLEIVRGTIQRIGSSGTRSGRDALMVFATGNKNQEFVSESFKALAKIGDKKAIEFLCGKNALRSGDFLVQQAAADALGEARSPLAVGPLLDVLTSPFTKIEVTGSVSRAVARSAPKDERVVETLFKLADGVKDTIRANAIEALGYLGSDRAMKRLQDALVNDKNTRVRGAAATGMKNSKRKDMIPSLEIALKIDKSMTVRDAIQTALTELSKH
jgi:HEAT repeat protein